MYHIFYSAHRIGKNRAYLVVIMECHVNILGGSVSVTRPRVSAASVLSLACRPPSPPPSPSHFLSIPSPLRSILPVPRFSL